MFNPISIDDKLEIAKKCYEQIMKQITPEDKILIEDNTVLSVFEESIKDNAYPNMRMLKNDIEDAINYLILKARNII